MKPHAAAQGTPATGRILGGRYRVGPVIRAGGMGSVYAGENIATGRRVALKLVHARVHNVTELEHRFEREARIASNVQSKHIVQVFDAGRDDALGPFIAMELLEGEDLEDRLASAGPLAPRVACAIAFQAARGLEKAHAANIAHRDLKPGNLFLVDSDEEELLVKVLDFGIAKTFDGHEEESPKLTRQGTTLGTPLYMSPEQARGREDIDGRSDVYSLGAVLYEMLVGRSHVPELPNYNQLVIHIATVPAPRVSASLPAIDPQLDRLVADMLVGDRRDRLQTMRMVRERLAPLLGAVGKVGSLSDMSGSFVAGREVSTVGFSSARIRAAAPVASPAPEEPDSEEVHFFERESAPPLHAATLVDAPTVPESVASSPAAPVPAPPSSRNGEEVVLFDRASLNLRVASFPPPERRSSGPHVIDSADAGPTRVLVIASVPPAALGSRPPAAGPAEARRAAKKAEARLIAVAAVATVAAAFLVLGSVRLARTFESSPAAAAAGGASFEPSVAPAAAPPSLAVPPDPAAALAAKDAGGAAAPSEPPGPGTR